MTDYRTIYLDPPWAERGGGKCKRGADRHYPLMSRDAIYQTIRMKAPGFLGANHCYMWVTNNFLPDGIELMRQMGFRYVTNCVWVKVLDVDLDALSLFGKMGRLIRVVTEAIQIGLGQYFRGAHELLLFGVDGDAVVPEPENRLPTVVFAPRGKHSAKPDVFYDRIEQTSPGPYLELFARNTRDGWDSWGNEI